MADNFTRNLYTAASEILGKRIADEQNSAYSAMEGRIVVLPTAATSVADADVLRKSMARYVYSRTPETVRANPEMLPLVVVHTPTQYIVYLRGEYPAKDAVAFLQATHLTVATVHGNDGEVHNGMALMSKKTSVFNTAVSENVAKLDNAMQGVFDTAEHHVAVPRGCAISIQTTPINNIVTTDYVDEDAFNALLKTAQATGPSKTIGEFIRDKAFATYIIRTSTSAAYFAYKVASFVGNTNAELLGTSKDNQSVTYRNFPVTIDSPDTLSSMYKDLWDTANPNNTKQFIGLPHGFVNGNSTDIRNFIQHAIDADPMTYGEFVTTWKRLCTPDADSKLATFVEPGGLPQIVSKTEIPSHDEKLFRSSVHDLMVHKIANARVSRTAKSAHWTTAGDGTLTPLATGTPQETSISFNTEYETLARTWADQICDSWNELTVSSSVDKHEIESKPNVQFLSENHHAAILVSNRMLSHEDAKLRIDRATAIGNK